MAMAKRAIPALSIAAVLILAEKNTNFSACESANNETVKEPFTGIEFPRLKEDYVLFGTAVRCMLGQCKFAKARAYAVGLYLEDGNNVHQCAHENSNDEVFRQVLRAPVARRLVLVMDKDVAGHHIAKKNTASIESVNRAFRVKGAKFGPKDGAHWGFDRSLLSRVRKAQGGQKSGPGKDALREFTHCFNQEKMLRKGTEVSLVWRPDDTLIISINSSEFLAPQQNPNMRKS